MHLDNAFDTWFCQRNTSGQRSATDYICGENCTVFIHRSGLMNEHIDSIMEIVDLLRGSGKPLENEEVIAVLLESLPESYSTRYSARR